MPLRLIEQATRMPRTKKNARRMHKLYDAGDVDGVLALISSGVNVNALDKNDVALLHKAIYNEKLVKALIDAGADVNVRVRCWLFV